MSSDVCNQGTSQGCSNTSAAREDARSAAWDADRVERLKKLWAQGCSGTEIAKLLYSEGFRPTRSAVIGKVNRLGLCRDEAAVNTERKKLRPSRETRPRRVVNARAPKPPKPKARYNLVAVNAVAKAEGKRGKHYDNVRAAPVADATLAKPWLERRFGECAYPISGEGADTFSCCQPAQPHGYCEAHASVMFYVPKESPRKLERLSRRYA
jgi:GcrA cell cycle regulator